MKLRIFKKINIIKGLTVYDAVEHEKSFKTVRELSDSNLLSVDIFLLNIKTDNPKINKMIKNLSSIFVVNKTKYTGFLVIDKNYIGKVIEYLWENAETSNGFKDILSNIKNGLQINKIMDKTSFYNKFLSSYFTSFQDLYELPKEIPEKSIFFKEDDWDKIDKIAPNKFSFELKEYDCIRCLAKPRIKNGVKIFDYIFKVKDFNDRRISRSRRIYSKRKINKRRRTTDLLSIYDGKVVELNNEIVRDFSDNGFIKYMSLSDNDILSMLTKTKYIIKKTTQDKKVKFEENVYFVSKNPEIILYDDFKVIGTENNNIDIISRIDDFIYHPDNKPNSDNNNFKIMTLGVIDDFFD